MVIKKNGRNIKAFMRLTAVRLPPFESVEVVKANGFLYNTLIMNLYLSILKNDKNISLSLINM